jgi:hypothetical protein
MGLPSHKTGQSKEAALDELANNRDSVSAFALPRRN